MTEHEKLIADLAEALSWFLEDPRFLVSVGGNPRVVERMINEARFRLESYQDAWEPA
jgi:hypothetical protein